MVCQQTFASCLTGKTEIPGQSVQFVSKQTDERQLQTYGDMCCLRCLLQHSSNENLLLLLNSADSRLSRHDCVIVPRNMAVKELTLLTHANRRL